MGKLAMKASDYKELETAIRALLKKQKNPYQVASKAVESQRIRWDALYATGLVQKGVISRFYKYLNDNHIDSALKQIMREYRG
jgi:hypothetical protein